MNKHKYLYISATVIIVTLSLVLAATSIVDAMAPEMTPPSPEILSQHRLSCDAANRWQRVSVTKSSYTLQCIAK